MDFGDGPAGSRAIQYDVASRSGPRSRDSLPKKRTIKAIGVKKTKKIIAITNGLKNLCKSNPNLNQIRFNGMSMAGANKALPRKMLLMTSPQCRISPPSDNNGNNPTIANTIAKTMPKERAEPGLRESSRSEDPWMFMLFLLLSVM